MIARPAPDRLLDVETSPTPSPPALQPASARYPPRQKPTPTQTRDERGGDPRRPRLEPHPPAATAWQRPEPCPDPLPRTDGHGQRPRGLRARRGEERARRRRRRVSFSCDFPHQRRQPRIRGPYPVPVVWQPVCTASTPALRLHLPLPLPSPPLPSTGPASNRSRRRDPGIIVRTITTYAGPDHIFPLAPVSPSSQPAPSQRAALFVIAPLLCCPGARESSVRSTILGQNRLTPAPRSSILDAHPACAPLLPVYSPHTPLSSPSPIRNDTLLCPGRFQHDHDH